MDPLVDVIGLLKPTATRWGGGFSARGEWALSFRARNDLLFCWVERGDCLLARPDMENLQMREGDFALIRTSTPFRLASDIAVQPVDIEDALRAAHGAKLKLGDDDGDVVTLHAGKFVFEAANQDLLSDLLPSLVHIAAGDGAYARVRSLLAMNEMESRQPGPASEFMIVRLMELVLVEILRTQRPGWGKGRTGLLAGLADVVTERALSAMHRDVAHDWTVEELARLCGVSRSAFASRFRQIVGSSPIDYLSRWRMALAKDALSRGTPSVGKIAFAIGFQSSSAFSSAFSRVVGCSPTRFADQIRSL